MLNPSLCWVGQTQDSNHIVRRQSSPDTYGAEHLSCQEAAMMDNLAILLAFWSWSKDSQHSQIIAQTDPDSGQTSPKWEKRNNINVRAHPWAQQVQDNSHTEHFKGTAGISCL